MFSIGSSVLMDSVFRAAMKREERSALDENQMLRFSFVTAVTSADNAAGYGIDRQSESVIRRIAWSLENSNGYCIRVSDAQHNTIYVSKTFRGGKDLARQAEDGQRVWLCFADETGHYIQSACSVTAGGGVFYLENLRNVSSVVDEQRQYLRLYQLLALCLIGLSTVIMLALSAYLTRPMHRLSAVSRRIAKGEYQLRCAPVSHDEIGALTEDFNDMADSLETKIRQLEDASRRQEDFIASFAHELKTPMTSIIGYSDMLRGQSLPPEQQFKAANYIYTEGKRLESLSYKLLDIIVYRRYDAQRDPLPIKTLLEELAAVLRPSFAEYGVALTLSAEEGVVLGESDLLKSMLVNLCDNARKASAEGSTVSMEGAWEKDGVYRITVRDQGCGIATEELKHITEPFYMVDKSRARAQNGAGLGLTLCAAIAALHDTALEFESEPGRGTAVSVRLKGAKGEKA